MREPLGLKKVGIATIIVGLILGIIVPFTQFGGRFPAPWVLGVAVLPLLWGATWIWLARRKNWGLVLLAQWLSLCLVLWLFIGPGTGWAPQAALGGLVLGSLILIVWMVPVGIVAMMPARR